MAKVVMYTTQQCPFCVRAKMLLHQKGVPFEEIDVGGNDALRMQLVEMSGVRRTVPQIFINDQPIGGFEELAALDASTRLADLVGESEDGDDVA